MLENLFYSNRVYATLGIDPDLLCLFERALDETFKKIRSILDDSQDPNDYIKFGLNKLEYTKICVGLGYIGTERINQYFYKDRAKKL